MLKNGVGCFEGKGGNQRHESEQRELSALVVDTLASLVEVFLVQFKADEVPTLLDASDGRRAAAHEGVECYAVWLATKSDTKSRKFNGESCLVSFIPRLYADIPNVSSCSHSVLAVRCSSKLRLMSWYVCVFVSMIKL